MKNCYPTVTGVLLLIACLSANGCSGCGTLPPPPPLQKQEGDLEKQAREEYNLAIDVTRFRRANGLANKYLAEQPSRLQSHQPASKELEKLKGLLGNATGDPSRAFLESFVGLDEAEIREVESGSFTLLDAHYLASCHQLHEIVHSMPLQDLSDLDKAKYCFRWVCRQVLLFEGRKGLLAPQFVLQAGEGNSAERGFLLIELLRQAQLDACAIGVPGKDGQTIPWLVGVLIGGKEKADLFLFDLRLDLPVPGPDGSGIATLEELRKNPKLLDGFKVAPEDLHYDVDSATAAKAQIMLAFPLSSLSARMRFLDDELLYGFSSSHFAIRPAAVIEKFTRLNLGPVQAWGASPKDSQSPVRSLRAFLPPEEGGVDTSARAQEFGQSLIPRTPFLQGLGELRLSVVDHGSPEIVNNLMGALAKLWDNFAREPAQKLQRGRLEDGVKRLDLMDKILETLDPPDPVAINNWRENARKAYISRSAERIDDIWNKDQLLSLLLKSPDEDISATKGLSRTVLSGILLTAARTPLQLEISRLFALQWQEKAERLQARKKSPADAWENADMYLQHSASDRDSSIGADAMKERWLTALQLLSGPVPQYADCADYLGYYEFLMRKAAAGKTERIDLLQNLGRKEAASNLAEYLVQTLGKVNNGDELAKLRKYFKNAPAPAMKTDPRGKGPAQNHLAEEVDMALADLGPGGTFFWQRYAAAIRLEQLKRAVKMPE